MNLIRNACTFIGQGHLIIGVKKKKNVPLSPAYTD